MEKTLDKKALKDEKEKQQRTDDDDGAGGDEGPLRADFAQLGKDRQPDCERTTRFAVGHDEGPEKIVPVKTDGRQ